MGILDTLGDLGHDAEGMLPGFLNPNRPQQQGGGLGIGTLFDALRQTGSTLAGVSPVGIAKNVVSGFDPNSHMDPFQRAMAIAPVALPLAGLGAYRMHEVAGEAGGYGSMFRDPTGAVAMNPEQSRPFQQAVGLPTDANYPSVPGMTTERQAGLGPRTNMILGATNDLQTVRALGRWGQDSQALGREAAAGTVLAGLTAQQLPPQEVLARADYSYQNSLVKNTGEGKRFNTLYGTFVKAPETLKPAQIQRLIGMLSDHYATTKSLDPELIVDPLLKVQQLQMLEPGTPAVAQTTKPLLVPSSIYGSTEPFQLTRARILGSMNHRSLFEPGLANIRFLLHRGLTDLADKLDRGLNWYPTARDEIFKRADAIKGLDRSKAVAAVSLTSASEDWRTNIDKAFDAMKVWDRPENYATDATGSEVPNVQWVPGENGRQLDTSFGLGKHVQELRDQGHSLTDADAIKLARLKNETPEDVFKSTASPSLKQKNFYTNLLHPELLDPVTIDRHAYDAFVGFETGTPDRPLDVRPEGTNAVRMRGATKGPWDDRVIYDVVQDAYRQVASEMNLPANAVQAVVWEVTKYLKQEHLEKYPDLLDVNGERRPGASTWQKSDPWRLNDYGLSQLEGSNPVGFRQLLTVAGDMQPVPVGSPTAGQAGVRVVAGRGAFAIDAGREELDHADTAVRVAYKALPLDANGSVWRLAPGFPVRLESYGDALNGLNGGALAPDGLPAASSVEVYHPILTTDGQVLPHPTTVPGNHAMVAANDDLTLRNVMAAYKEAGVPEENIRTIPGVASFEPALTRLRLGEDDITPSDFTSLDGPIHHNQWTVVSAHLSDAQIKEHGLTGWDNNAKHRELADRLRKMGYKPIDQMGDYPMEDNPLPGSGREPSYLTFGLKPTDALKLGDEYYQDSVLTQYGLLYGKHSPKAGLYTPGQGEVQWNPEHGELPPTDVEFNQDVSHYYSEVPLGPGGKMGTHDLPGPKIKYQMQLDFSGDAPVDFDPDAYLTKPVERTHDYVWAQLPDDMITPDLLRMMDAVTAAGGERQLLYTHHPMGEGHTKVVEHHYVTTAPQQGAMSQATGTQLPTTPAGITVVHRGRAAGDLEAPNRFVAWMRDADAKWLDDVPSDMNAAAPTSRLSAPKPMPDGTWVAHNDTRINLIGTGTVEPTIFNTKVEGKYAQHFAVEFPEGQLPLVTLSTQPINKPDVVTGQVLRRQVKLVAPTVPGGIDVGAVSKTLTVLRRNGVNIRNGDLQRVLGTDGQYYTANGERVEVA